MTLVDWSSIVLYFVLVVGLGFWYQRRAARDVESYFLGGRRMHWLFLAMSGAVSNFDITGTMWIVSILYLLGMKSMWNHWMWGVFAGAFFLSFMGKWVRRSRVLTAAEWMMTRFGTTASGHLARATYAAVAVLFLAAFVGYAYQGIGKFASEYVPLGEMAAAVLPTGIADIVASHDRALLALAIIGVTTLYVVLGGLWSVVVTDVVQTIVLTVGAVFIAVLAWVKLTPEALSRVPADWGSLTVPWRLGADAGTPAFEYELFGMLVLVWVVKGLLLNLGGPGQMYDFQRFLAARNARDASKVGAAWSVFLVVRWAMTAGIALLAVSGAAGIRDPETAMPVILRDHLPSGIRGVVLAGLLAAFMSTFSSTINSGASFLVRDLWQAYLRPNAPPKEVVRVSYVATLLLVVVGLLFGIAASSITQIWGWIMMSLGAGLLVPNVLRWYWWRLNGAGYAAGTITGVVLSFATLLVPAMPVYWSFGAICVASLGGAVLVSFLTRPVPFDVLGSFYRTVRPFGLWGPVRSQLDGGSTERPDRREGFLLAACNVVLGIAAITGAYLAPMYLVGHFYGKAAAFGGLFLAAAGLLYVTWYRNLPLREPD